MCTVTIEELRMVVLPEVISTMAIQVSLLILLIMIMSAIFFMPVMVQANISVG